jgi:hypothetical protein
MALSWCGPSRDLKRPTKTAPTWGPGCRAAGRGGQRGQGAGRRGVGASGARVQGGGAWAEPWRAEQPPEPPCAARIRGSQHPAGQRPRHGLPRKALCVLQAVRAPAAPRPAPPRPRTHLAGVHQPRPRAHRRRGRLRRWALPLPLRPAPLPLRAVAGALARPLAAHGAVRGTAAARALAAVARVRCGGTGKAVAYEMWGYGPCRGKPGSQSPALPGRQASHALRCSLARRCPRPLPHPARPGPAAGPPARAARRWRRWSAAPLPRPPCAPGRQTPRRVGGRAGAHGWPRGRPLHAAGRPSPPPSPPDLSPAALAPPARTSTCTPRARAPRPPPRGRAPAQPARAAAPPRPRHTRPQRVRLHARQAREWRVFERARRPRAAQVVGTADTACSRGAGLRRAVTHALTAGPRPAAHLALPLASLVLLEHLALQLHLRPHTCAGGDTSASRPASDRIACRAEQLGVPALLRMLCLRAIQGCADAFLFV